MLEHLAHGRTSLVVSDGFGSPRVLYWGSRLPDDVGLAELSRALEPGRPHGRMDEADPLTLVPEHARGFVGRPGLLGARMDGTAWAPRFEQSEFLRSGNRLSMTSIDEVAGLRLRCTIELSDVLSATAEITNTGSSPYLLQSLSPTLPLPHQAQELVSFTGAWALEFQPLRRAWTTGAQSSENRAGRTSHDRPPLLVAGTPAFGEWSGEVWAVHLAWSANHLWHAEVLADARRYLQIGELLHPGEVILDPGESYCSPTVLAAYSSSGTNEISRGFHRRARSLPTAPKRPRRVLLNTWEAVYFDHDTTRLLALAEQAADIGVELFVLDDGWFSSRRSDRSGLGDWWVSPDVYPSGLGPLIDHVRSLGMDFGIWVEPEMANPDSELLRAHPDWVLATPGYAAPTGRNQVVVDLTIPAAFDHVRTALHRLLADHDISFVKWDMNRNHVQASSSVGSAGTHQQTLAVYRLFEALRALHPTVEFESCASGGARIDHAMLGVAERVWTSDSNDALERQRIQHSLSLHIPPERMGAHIGAPRAHTTGRRHTLAFRAATAFFGHLGIEWNLLETSESERTQLRRVIELHKRFRPLLHGGDAVRFDHADTSLLATGVYSADRSEALVSIARLSSSVAPAGTPLRLPGLDPNMQYHVNVLELVEQTSIGPAVAQPDWVLRGIRLSGSQLALHGLQPPVMWPESALILHVRTAAQ